MVSDLVREGEVAAYQQDREDQDFEARIGRQERVRPIERRPVGQQVKQRTESDLGFVQLVLNDVAQDRKAGTDHENPSNNTNNYGLDFRGHSCLTLEGGKVEAPSDNGEN
jgi:hypothetical protein